MLLRAIKDIKKNDNIWFIRIFLNNLPDSVVIGCTEILNIIWKYFFIRINFVTIVLLIDQLIHKTHFIIIIINENYGVNYS